MAFAIPANGNFDNNDGVIDIMPPNEAQNSGQVRGSTLGTLGGIAAGAAAQAAAERIGPIVYDATGKVIDFASKKLNNRNNRNSKGGSNGGRKGKGNGNYRRSDYNDGGSNSNNGGGSGGRSSAGGSTGNRSGIDSLSFSSGIDAGLVVNSRLQKSDLTPLYLASGWLFKVTDAGIENINTQFDEELEKVIFPVYEQIISNVINRWVGQYVSKEEFLEYFHYVTEALQVFYTIDSILAYSSNNTLDNVNYGMESLRNQLTAQVLMEHGLLKESLENSTVPKNLLEFIRWFMQSYRTSDAPHAPIIRINVGGMFDSNWNGEVYTRISEMLRVARQNLLSVNKVMSYLNRAFPQWTINSLPPSVKRANFDKDFFTFWHNQNCCYIKLPGTTKFDYTHTTNSLDEYLDYQILERDRDVDGAIFASASTFYQKDGVTEKTAWGIWQPFASVADKDIPPGNQSSSFNIKMIDETGKAIPVLNQIVAGRSGIHWMMEYSGNPPTLAGLNKQFGTHGFVDLQNVNPRMQAEAFNNTVRLLMDPPRIR